MRCRWWIQLFLFLCSIYAESFAIGDLFCIAYLLSHCFVWITIYLLSFSVLHTYVYWILHCSVMIGIMLPLPPLFAYIKLQLLWFSPEMDADDWLNLFFNIINTHFLFVIVWMCSHLLYFVVACRAECHERWDAFEPHGTRLLELPRWFADVFEGTPPDWCHGPQRVGKALWFHDNDQPPTQYIWF